MANNTEFKIIEERINPILSMRYNQLEINLLGLYGGRPYVEERLSRFAGESQIDWSGGTRVDGSIVTGRLEQAHCIPYLGRIAEKINQHVLGVSPSRPNADNAILEDITTDGLSINQFMREVNIIVTACRWAWIGIDAPANQSGRQISQAEKVSKKIRPYWTLYSPLDVLDWCFDSKGGLLWLLTETTETEGTDPRAKQSATKKRMLWEPGKVTTYIYGKNGHITDQAEVALSLQKIVPFLPVGTISPKPYKFDDLESINRTIMDLESCNRQNFFNTVFPQAYLPESVLEAVMQKFNVTAEEAVSRIIGYNYPIIVPKDEKEPGYMMPDASAIGTMGEELKRLRKELYDTVGLMLQQETREAISAESKAWDFLDIEAVMRERANVLEDAEKKAVAISKAWDNDFPGWLPTYNRTFAVRDFKAEVEALVMAGNVSMPPEMQKFVLEKLFDAISQLGAETIDPKRQDKIIKAISDFAGGGNMELIIDKALA